MTYLVENLRTAANDNRVMALRGADPSGEVLGRAQRAAKRAMAETLDAAADEIERLRAEVDRLGRVTDALGVRKS